MEGIREKLNKERGCEKIRKWEGNNLGFTPRATRNQTW